MKSINKFFHSFFIQYAFATSIILGNIAMSQYSFAEITIKNGKVSASYTNEKLEDALSEIVDKTGIEILTTDSLDSELYVSYKDITLEQLLKNLLVNKNAIYIRNQQTNEIEMVRIFGAQSVAANGNDKLVMTDSTVTQKDNSYYINVALNGRKFEMLIDTGADSLVISGAVANQLGLTRGDRVNMNTAGGLSYGYKTIIESFSMAGMVINKQQAIILDTVPGNGLIGNSVLHKFPYTQSNGKIVFHNNNKEGAKNQQQNQPKTQEETPKDISKTIQTRPQIEPPPSK